MFEPLKIEFYMQTPICLSSPWISFDGLLAHLKLKEELKDGYHILPSKTPADFSSLTLPIEKVWSPEEGIFIYKSSISIFDNDYLFLSKIYKRFYVRDIDRVSTKKKKITRGSGHYRDFIIALPYVPAKTVIFYVNGDKSEIESLLSTLVGLGKKTAIGYGFFNDFSITRIQKDKSLVDSGERMGRAMRPIPISFLEGSNYQVSLLSYIFPYWDKRNITLCANPFAIVKLKGEI
jgi:CRISPR type IV-associated protein Csf3